MIKNFFPFENIQTHSLNQTDKNLAMLSLEVTSCLLECMIYTKNHTIILFI